MELLDRLVGVVVRPIPTFRVMVENPCLTNAFFIVISASVCASLASLIATPRAAQVTLAPEFLRLLYSPEFIVPVGVVAGVLFWIIFGTILHGFSKLLGGKGKVNQTLLVYGFSEVPALYSVAFGMLSWILASQLPYQIGSILLGLWSLILLVLGLREAHKFSTLRAISAIVLPIVIIIIIVVVILLAVLLPIMMWGV